MKEGEDAVQEKKRKEKKRKEKKRKEKGGFLTIRDSLLLDPTVSAA